MDEKQRMIEAACKSSKDNNFCNNDCEYCPYKVIADILISEGFGEVSGYKAEIEQLKAKQERMQNGEGYGTFTQLAALLEKEAKESREKDKRIAVLERALQILSVNVLDKYISPCDMCLNATSEQHECVHNSEMVVKAMIAQAEQECAAEEKE